MIIDTSLPFRDYITSCQALIKSARPDLLSPDNSLVLKEKILLANSPFELRPNGPLKQGALLIHGLFGSPCAMRDIGQALYQDDTLVRAILLPGHGTTPSGLLHVTYQEWLDTVRYGIATLREEVEKIYLVGFSTGAALALYHLLKEEIDIAGLILIAPPIKIKSPFDFMSNWHHVISRKWKRAAWFTIQPENDYAKYQSITFNSIYQVYQLARAIKTISVTRTISCPVLLILSKNDDVISTPRALDYFKKYADAQTSTMMFDVPHLAIPISPDNAHYGIDGDYKNKELTYNPDFASIAKGCRKIIV